MEERIDTSRFNRITQIDALTAAQMMAVSRLRKFAASQGVSPYTLGVLCNRDTAQLLKLSDGARYARLTPASRELLISEIRDEVHPHEPSAVAIFSHWATINDVNCDEYDQTPQLSLVVPETKTPREAQYDALAELASEYGLSTTAFARWCEDIYPHKSRHLPDRESDEGVELADQAFQLSMPYMPRTVATWRYRRGFGGPISHHQDYKGNA
jgi:hypothetical protein